MAGLIPKFTIAAVRQHINQRVDEAESKMIEALQYAGEEFITNAKVRGTYENRTGNLRASIGYIILKNGRNIESEFIGGNQDGENAGIDAANEVAREHPKGFVLIGVAGMNYAAAVESKNYDVITGSEPSSESLKDLFGAIKF